jgi:hypothetical protein
MENKDRDKLSRSTTPTSAGNVNRSTSERMGQEKSGSSAEFGQKIGRSEDPQHEPSGRSGNLDPSGNTSSPSSGSDWNVSGSDRSNSSSSDRNSGFNRNDDETGSSSGRH